MSYVRRILAVDPAAVFEIVGADEYKNIVWKTAPIEKAVLDAINIAALDESEKALRELEKIDLGSIRALREYVAAQRDAPQWLKDKEQAAQSARAKLKGV